MGSAIINKDWQTSWLQDSELLLYSLWIYKKEMSYAIYLAYWARKSLSRSLHGLYDSKHPLRVCSLRKSKGLSNVSIYIKGLRKMLSQVLVISDSMASWTRQSIRIQRLMFHYNGSRTSLFKSIKLVGTTAGVAGLFPSYWAWICQVLHTVF